MIEEEYADVLQNIEATIVEFHRGHPDLLDYDVEAVLDALIADYRAEQGGRAVADRQLPGLRQPLLDDVRWICQWRLGRVQEGPVDVPVRVITVEEMVACLNRLRKSVRRWTKEGGRQGYLRFVRQYVFFN